MLLVNGCRRIKQVQWRMAASSKGSGSVGYVPAMLERNHILQINHVSAKWTGVWTSFWIYTGHTTLSVLGGGIEARLSKTFKANKSQRLGWTQLFQQTNRLNNESSLLDLESFYRATVSFAFYVYQTLTTPWRILLTAVQKLFHHEISIW